MGMEENEVGYMEATRKGLWRQGRSQGNSVSLLGVGVLMVSSVETGEVRIGVCCERKNRGLVEDVLSCWNPELRSCLWVHCIITLRDPTRMGGFSFGYCEEGSDIERYS